MTTTHWQRNPDDFAARIDIQALRGFFRKDLIVEPGTRAIFLTDGRNWAGELGPGRHPMQLLTQRLSAPLRGAQTMTALLVDAGEVDLEFRVDLDLSVPIVAELRVVVRLNEALPFFINLMRGRPSYSEEDLKRYLEPEVRDAVREAVRSVPVSELGGNFRLKQQQALHMDRHLEETCRAVGLKFERVRGLQFIPGGSMRESSGSHGGTSSTSGPITINVGPGGSGPTWLLAAFLTVLAAVIIVVVALLLRPDGGSSEGAVATTSWSPSPLPPTTTAPESTDTPWSATSAAEPTVVAQIPDTPTVVPPSPTPTPTPQSTTPIPPTTPVPPPPQPTTPTPTPSTTPTPPEKPATSSPTGKIAFPIFDGTTYNLHVARAPTGWQPQLLVREASQPAYSPDGVYLAYRSWRSDQRGLWTARADGSQARRITEQNAWEDAVPRWRFSDRQLVFCRRGQGIPSELYQVWGLGGGPVERIWAAGTGIYGEAPVWLPGGTIVFQRRKDTGDRIGLWIVTETGQILRQVTDDASDTAPAVAKNGQIAFMRRADDGQWEVYQVNGDGSGPVNLSQHGADDGLPTWSPDGKYVAFVSDRGGGWAVWTVPAGGGAAQKLFSVGQLHGIPASDTTHSTRGWVDESISWAKE